MEIGNNKIKIAIGRFCFLIGEREREPQGAAGRSFPAVAPKADVEIAFAISFSPAAEKNG